MKKRLFTITLAMLLMATVTAPAVAWEFSMTGQWEYRLRYWARLGGADLFGIHDVGNNLLGIPVGFAGPNIYNRGAVPAAFASKSSGKVVITRGGFSQSESDAFQDDARIEINPLIAVNPALRVFGRYNIGGIRNKYFQNAGGVGVPPYERYVTFRTSENAYDTAGIGSWETFLATMQLPWGMIVMGNKWQAFGLGARAGLNTRCTAFVLQVPYGPFQFVAGGCWARGLLPSGQGWATVPDNATKRTMAPRFLTAYNNGPLTLAARIIWIQYHANHGEVATNFPALAAVRGGLDINQVVYDTYMKYNNGRIFMNIEYDWFRTDYYWLSNNGVGGSPPRYDEGYLWFSEVGGFTGPVKMSFLHAISSGRVLNSGNVTKNYRPNAINNQATEGYQYLMFNTFAGGNNGGWNEMDFNATADEVGKMTDAFCLAARVDYAVASNLNVYGTYMWAHRLEKAGFYKGGTLSTGAAATPVQRQTFVLQNFHAASGEVGGPINPYVDDGFIGWEATLGFDWKLLENFTFSTKYAYWQPGEWFEQAYQAVGMRNGTAVTNALVKGRAPIMALWSSLVVKF